MPFTSPAFRANLTAAGRARGIPARRQIPGVLSEEQEQSEIAMGRGRGASDEWAAALRGFDPQSYARQTLNYGVLPGVYREMGEMRDANAFDRNRRGMLGAGVDAGRERRAFDDRMSQEMAKYSMDAAGMNLSKIGQMGSRAGLETEAGTRRRETYLDFLSGAADRETAEENARRQSRGGGFMGMLGSVAGAFGGPLLGAAGGALGERAGRWFGGR